MAARNVNLVLEQGVDFQATFSINNVYNNTPLNLVGYAGISSIRKHPDSSTAYPLTVKFTDRLRGKVQVSMGYSATSLIEGGRYVYDLVLISPNSLRTRAVQGNVLVTPGVV
tara:strand:+ start:998 stop:1333 length:336 start_codon:yes stop_codon:yes gene_type:complete